MSLLRNIKVLYRGSLIAVLVSFTHVTQGAKYSCQASISVSEGSAANISCYFSEDVQVTKKNVKIHKIAGQFHPDAVVVAECFWSDAQSFRCDQQGGYKLLGEITNRATLAIPWATKAFEGKYMCELVPSEPSDIEPCEFRLEERADAININLSAPDTRSLIIAAIAISALSLVIVVLSIFLRDRIIVFTQNSWCKNRHRRKSSSNVKKCKEDDPLVEDDVPHTTVGDKSIGSDDKSLSHLSEIVHNSVKSALLEVSQTDTGTMVISTMSEIQRKWQTRNVPLSNDQAQRSTRGAVNTSSASSGKNNPRDHPRDSRPQVSSQHGYDKIATPDETFGTRSDKGTVGNSNAPVARTQVGENQSGKSKFYVDSPRDLRKSQQEFKISSAAEGNLSGDQVRQVTQDSKNKKQSHQGSVKGKDKLADAKSKESSRKKNKKWSSFSLPKRSKTSEKAPDISESTDV